LQSFGAEPQPDAADGSELSKAFKDAANGASDRLIGMQQYFAILIAVNKTCRQSAAQFTPRGLVSNATIQTRTQGM
jgi:hypothetical protein